MVMGDGEIEEGAVWEAAMAGAKFRTAHCIAILDHNGVQLDGANNEIMPLADIGAKWAAFGWNVIHCDGHDAAAIEAAVTAAKSVTDRPSILICRTVKGKGVSFMENQCGWHGVAPNDEQYKQAMAELKAQLVH